jgi:small subunit ribosomal protein S17
MAEQMTKKIGKKVLEGKVVSDKMQKTITVQVSRRTLHPVYQKYLTMSKKYKAHDEQETAKVGDTVKIQECRPISKDKVWTLLDVVERAK